MRLSKSLRFVFRVHLVFLFLYPFLTLPFYRSLTWDSFSILVLTSGIYGTFSTQLLLFVPLLPLFSRKFKQVLPFETFLSSLEFGAFHLLSFTIGKHIQPHGNFYSWITNSEKSLTIHIIIMSYAKNLFCFNDNHNLC